MSQQLTDDFARALQRLESDHDLDAFLRAFAADVELQRPEQRQQTERGGEGARRFWGAYLQQFDEVRTDFTRVSAAGNLGVLEWVSEGRLGSGRPITYAGVSLLTFDDGGQVARFATYYDTAAFVQATG